MLLLLSARLPPRPPRTKALRRHHEVRVRRVWLGRGLRVAAGADWRGRCVGAHPRVAAPQLRDEGQGSRHSARALMHMGMSEQHSLKTSSHNASPTVVLDM